MKHIVLAIYFLTSLAARGQKGDDINYSPQLLLKELKELTNGEEIQFNELQTPAALNNGQALRGRFFGASFGNNTVIAVYIGRVQSCRSGGCSSQLITDSEGDFEYFDYFIIYDSEKKIKSVRVFNYEATHGQEITIRKWLDQFTGYNGNKPLRVGREIDSISGATISVFGLVADIQQKTAILKSMEF